MNVEPLTILATIVNFVILFFILKHFLFKPVNEALESRENEIVTRIDKSIEDQKKAEELRQENELKLKGAAQEGKKIVEEFKGKAEKTSSDIIQQANAEAQNTLERGKQELQREYEKAESDIKTHVVDLAVMLSSEVLGETIDEAQHRKLIEQFIAKVGM